MLSASVIIAVYSAVFFGFITGMLLWRKRQRKDRRPFPENLKLLRGPGESSHRQLTKLDEHIVDYLLLAFILPVAVSVALLWVTLHLRGIWQIVALAVTMLGLVGSLYAVSRFLAQKVQESANRYLGFFGERIVAEALEPLKA